MSKIEYPKTGEKRSQLINLTGLQIPFEIEWSMGEEQGGGPDCSVIQHWKISQIFGNIAYSQNGLFPPPPFSNDKSIKRCYFSIRICPYARPNSLLLFRKVFFKNRRFSNALLKRSIRIERVFWALIILKEVVPWNIFKEHNFFIDKFYLLITLQIWKRTWVYGEVMIKWNKIYIYL